VNDIGMKMKSVEKCKGLKWIRYDSLKLENEMMSKKWKIKFLMENMDKRNRLIRE
jgi:hypothetical protein